MAPLFWYKKWIKTKKLIWLNISSKSSGKSGGGRIITCVKVTDEQIFLAYIYDKSDESAVSDKRLKEWAKLIK